MPISNIKETEKQTNLGAEHPTEHEIERLRRELSEKQTQLTQLRERKGEKFGAIVERKKEDEKRIEKERSEVAHLKETPSGTAPAQQISKVIKDEDIVKDLQHVMSLPKPRQVKVLIYFAFKKGLAHAVRIAEKMKSPYFLDEFHDTLVDELYELLKKKKKI